MRFNIGRFRDILAFRQAGTTMTQEVTHRRFEKSSVRTDGGVLAARTDLLPAAGGLALLPLVHYVTQSLADAGKKFGDLLEAGTGGSDRTEEPFRRHRRDCHAGGPAQRPTTAAGQ